MKDFIAKRACNQFFEIMQDFKEGLTEHEFTTAENEKHKLFFRTFNDTSSTHSKEQVITEFRTTLMTPLAKGCAKYAKAVQSITSEPAVVYHAVHYNDSNACEMSSPLFKALSIAEMTGGSDSPLKDAEKRVVWDYLKELSKLAFDAARISYPVVPSPTEIAENISKRKNEKKTESAVLNQSVQEIWSKLCDSRQLTQENKNISVLLAGMRSTDADVAARTPSAEEEFMTTFPYFRDTTPFSANEWDMISKAKALATMENAIPSNMMKGIEHMASRLCEDIQNGKASLSDINVETIGKEVLQGVSREDVNMFASNIDKLLPAITSMQQRQ